MLYKQPVQSCLTYSGTSDQFIHKKFPVDMAADKFYTTLQRLRHSTAFSLFGKFDQKFKCQHAKPVIQSGDIRSGNSNYFIKKAIDLAAVG